MEEAFQQAKLAYQEDEVPIGAVVVKDGKIIGKGHNQRVNKHSALWHAEMVAIDDACNHLGVWNLEDAELYVTLEPCPMCAGACMQARIKKIYYGAKDPKAGSVGSLVNLYSIKGYNHYPEVEGGILEEECASILREYFQEKRKKKKNNDE